MSNAPKPTDEQILAATTLFAAMAYKDEITPVVKAIKEQVLAANEFTVGGALANRWTNRRQEELPKLVKSESDVFLMDDESTKKFYELLHVEYVKQGFELPEPGYCPLLMAESKVIDAENLLIDVMEPTIKVKRNQIILVSHRNKLIGLTLKYLGPFVKDTMKFKA